MTSETIICAHFRWILYRRGTTYYADGRSNDVRLGRHSLGTTTYTEAKQSLNELDLVKAVELGRAEKSTLNHRSSGQLELEKVCHEYLAHVGRPQVLGGARPSTVKRYKAVIDKFVSFAEQRGVSTWEEVTSPLVEAYAAHLEDNDYAPRSMYLELTTIKQIQKWLCDANRLPIAAALRVKLSKAKGSDTHCWTAAQVEAMVAHCRNQPELQWIERVIVFLACTGMRISELVSLRWTDIDLKGMLLSIADESGKARRSDRKRRTTKSGKGRVFPINPALAALLAKMDRSDDGAVLVGPRGGRLKPDVIRRALVRDVLTPLETRFPTPEGVIGFHDGRLHSFRHFFCSECANANVPQQMLMAWLGHSDSDMVRHYYHLYDAAARAQMDRISFIGTHDFGNGAGVKGNDGVKEEAKAVQKAAMDRCRFRS